MQDGLIVRPGRSAVEDFRLVWKQIHGGVSWEKNPWVWVIEFKKLEQQEDGMNKLLFCDLKTDEEKAEFFLSGRGYETGVIAHSIQNDVAMAYHRCAEFEKELAAIQAECERLTRYYKNAIEFKAREAGND